MRTLWKILKIIAIVIVLLLVGLRLALSPLVKTVANKVLPEALGTEASLGDVSFGFLRGTTGLGDLRIGQPKGFDTEDKDLFRFSSFEAKVRPGTLKSGEVEVERLELKDLYVHVIRNKDGVLNVAQLGAKEKAAEPEVKAPVEKKEEEARPLRVKLLAVRNGTIKYTDYGLGENPVRVNVTDIDFEVKDLLLDAKADASVVEPAIVSLVARLKQEGVPDGRLGLVARVGPVGEAIPPVNASARLVGFDLTPFKPLVPPATLTLLGGMGLDLTADVGLAPDLLEVGGEVVMAGGSTFPFRVGGTPEKPEFDTSSVLFGTMGRVSGAVSGTAKDVAETGKAAAGAVVEGAGALAGGAFKAIGGLGRAVKDTAEAGIKGDLKDAGSALVGGVSEAAGEASESVKDTASSAKEGLEASAEALSGADALQAWRDATDTRWDAAWAGAQERVATAPFPPAREAAPSAP
ncbi:MAG TPA: AsmA family protein [Kiritimatiellia bacterium]|nr:AsmA family protein [Kiritimatiellia bacterium]HRZ11996.1 AsmA family protein [Kiritimatiellia bacterium]HSA17198.1 AsmA family protein [Kiritimatiellia bacterium]